MANFTSVMSELNNLKTGLVLVSGSQYMGGKKSTYWMAFSRYLT